MIKRSGTTLRATGAVTLLGVVIIVAAIAIRTIAVSSAPFGVAVNPTTNRVYVVQSGYGAGTVTVIDGATDNVLARGITVGNMPRNVAVNPQTNRVYITNGTSHTVTVIDGQTNAAIATIPLTTAPAASPWGIAANPTTNRVYVTNQGAGSVSVIDGATNQVLGSPISVGVFPAGVAVDATHNRIYVASRTSATVSVIDGQTNTVIATTPPSGSPWAIALDPAQERLYVTNANHGTLAVFDTQPVSSGAPPAPVTTIPVGTFPFAVAVHPTTHQVYVANRTSHTVSVIDGATNAITATHNVLDQPQGIDLNPQTGRVYVSNYGAATVSVLFDEAAPVDTVPPVVTVPPNLTVEATSAAGATVTFTAAATDAVDGPVPVTCTPASDTTFPLGTTAVTCTAHDAAGNTGSAGFTVTVQDTTPPVLTLPDNITTEANSTTAVGAAVTFTTTARDQVDGPVGVTCTPSSGATFALGATTVQCTATDAHGNTASGSFTVTVTITYDGLCDLVKRMVTRQGIANSLCAKLRAAAAAEARGNLNAKAGSLEAFKHEVEAQSGKALTEAQATILIRLADAL